MSIATKKGDRGETGLMYNRRVPKSDSRIEAGGAVDELNAALGHARATGTAEFITGNLLLIQKDLVVLMGELATLSEDRERYLRDGFVLISKEETQKLDDLVSKIEGESVSFKGWAHSWSNNPCGGLGPSRERHAGARSGVFAQCKPPGICRTKKFWFISTVCPTFFG